MQQITRISPCVFTNKYDDYSNPIYSYEEEIIVGADALRYRNGEGEGAICIGKETVASGNYAQALGIGTSASEEGAFACGKYNVGGGLFEVGCGTNSLDRKNAITVSTDGKVIINSIQANADGSIILPGLTIAANSPSSIEIRADGIVSIPNLEQLNNYVPNQTYVNAMSSMDASIKQNTTKITALEERTGEYLTRLINYDEQVKVHSQNFESQIYALHSGEFYTIINTICTVMISIANKIESIHTSKAAGFASSVAASCNSIKSTLDNFINNYSNNVNKYRNEYPNF